MKTKDCLCGLITLFLAFASSVFSEEAALDSLLPLLSSRVEKATLTSDSAGYDVVLAQCEALHARLPSNPWPLYYKSLALLNRVSAMGEDVAKEKRRALYDAAELAAAEALKLKDDPEILALHASVLERSLSVRGGFAMMELGPRAGSEHQRAQGLAPENPRVLLAGGVSLLFKPAFVGGSPEKALKAFEKAVELFKKEVPHGEAPSWGAAEAYMWVGQAQQRLGDRTAAKAAFLKALELAPEYRYVKYVLLPQVE